MSLNKSNIEWTQYTWNPIVGCNGPGGTNEKPRRCWYCYAEELATGPRQLLTCPKCRTFEPHFHSERLHIPNGKPKTIFFGSMCDAWGDWVPKEWLAKCIGVMAEHSLPLAAFEGNMTHRFLTLTKNPKRYLEFADMLPDNLSCGVTVTDDIDACERLPDMAVLRNNKFVSFEPLLDYPLDGNFRPNMVKRMDWIIIGCLNKRGHPPVTQREWVERIIELAQSAGVPVFLKENLWKLGVMTKAEVKALQQTPWKDY